MNKFLLGVCLCVAIFCSQSKAQAGVIFYDDFADGDTAGWSFYGNPVGSWYVSGGALHRQHGTYYSSNFYRGDDFALINGLTTPDQFSLEADVRVIPYYSSDFGHVGLTWGVNDTADPLQSYDVALLRIHQDKVALWSVVSDVASAEHSLNTPEAAGNVTYHFEVDVDRVMRSMTVTLGSDTATFSGSAFDKINQNSGGGLGLIAFWADHVTYDNVKVTVPDSTVPEPATMVLFGIGSAVMAFARRKKRA